MIPRRLSRVLFLAFSLVMVFVLYSMLQSVGNNSGDHQVSADMSGERRTSVSFLALEIKGRPSGRTSRSSRGIHPRSRSIDEGRRNETEAATSTAAATSGAHTRKSASETGRKQTESECRSSVYVAKQCSDQHDFRGRSAVLYNFIRIHFLAVVALDSSIVRCAAVR